ncbi:hypothetical protein HWC53_gp133 [Bacillus phage vB_BmeM-Goe8]|uniref:Uncharacterized protein n=1 Tax=Bacillus phage vB_BmeM-Goe8 TaxID=2593638 RepID=A0A516KMZ8_9CAUD|nr:hypothetical protein HWC53_gp133 [Bacillus phage vB_BmeM-Goe8]QDP42956.1 hypothetical protein Goe8_c01830 [Bacillus phage vB_BmeM-Goe8]
MEFWAIAYRYEEDVFYDFEKKEDTFDLGPTCFLPTEEMAEQIIEDELSIQYVAVRINVETIEKSGNWSWSRDEIPDWDYMEGFEEDE